MITIQTDSIAGYPAHVIRRLLRRGRFHHLWDTGLVDEVIGIGRDEAWLLLEDLAGSGYVRMAGEGDLWMTTIAGDAIADDEDPLPDSHARRKLKFATYPLD